MHVVKSFTDAKNEVLLFLPTAVKKKPSKYVTVYGLNTNLS